MARHQNVFRQEVDTGEQCGFKSQGKSSGTVHRKGTGRKHYGRIRQGMDVQLFRDGLRVEEKMLGLFLREALCLSVQQIDAVQVGASTMVECVRT